MTMVVVFDMPPSNRLASQKGSDQFRHSTIEEETLAASKSVKRRWWEYLRLSKDYWFVCKTSQASGWPRTIDENLRCIYIRFGNVHDCTFDEW